MKNLNEIDGKILEIGNKDYKINLIEDLTRDSDDLGQCCYRKSYINIEAKLINTPEIMLEAEPRQKVFIQKCRDRPFYSKMRVEHMV